MAKLDIQRQVGMDEGRAAYANTPALVNQIFTTQHRFSIPPRPQILVQNTAVDFDGRLPHDLTALSDDDLGLWLGIMSAYIGYVEAKLAEAEMNLLAAKEARDFVEAKIRLSYSTDSDGKKLGVKERDDLVRTDRIFVEANSQAIFYEAMWKLTRAVNNTAQNSFMTLSRRITQRGFDVDKDRRFVNVGNMTTGQPLFGPRR